MKNAYYNNKKLLISILWIVIGATILTLAVAELLDSSMWGGFGGGLLGVGIMQLVMNLKYRSDSNYKQKIDIQASDERNVYLRMKAWSWTGYVVTIGSAILSVVFLILGRSELSQILGLVTCAEIFIFYVAFLILGKKY